MAINWKGWTSRLPVKICCVILIPVTAFVFLCCGMRLAKMNLSYSERNMVFAKFEDSNFFFDSYASTAMSHAQILNSYKSEDNIRNMEFLEWRPVRDGSYPAYEGNAVSVYEGTAQTGTRRWELENSSYAVSSGDWGKIIVTYDAEESSASSDEPESEWMQLVSTNFTDYNQTWGEARRSDLESPEAKRMVNGAINYQLSEYRRAKEWLDTTGGLYYYISDGKETVTNVPGQDVSFFRRQPVYILQGANGLSEQSRQGYSGWTYESSENANVYIAFSKEAVDAQNYVWKTRQRQFTTQIAIMTGAVLAALILLVILTAGAGRRRADNGESVHFTALDKPWLDIGLCLLMGYAAAFGSLIVFSAEAAWRYDNIRWLIALCAIFAAGLTLPVLWWILSFTKRCKAGKWWRHTMFYRIYDKCKSFVKSLWAGFPLTAKAVLAGIAFFLSMLVIAMMNIRYNAGGVFAWIVICTAIVAVGLLRYARRLHMLEQGAKNAGGGLHGAPIAVKGGELGSIADSINRISENINSAVSERMKSERLKTELFTNVSHDIRTPLTSLITYTDLLKNEGLDSEKAPEYLEVLIQKSARLKTLTDDLFEASKAAGGNIEAHLETLDLSDFVQQVLGELDERVIASGMDFRLNLPEHALVLADGKLLWRVMSNLLSNVFKYAQKGSRVYIDVARENGEYRLDVKNISEHPLNVEPSELTERFKRGDSARSDEGSGLGLSIAQSFVQAQGGRFALSVDGDLFKATLYLPAEK